MKWFLVTGPDGPTGIVKARNAREARKKSHSAVRLGLLGDGWSIGDVDEAADEMTMEIASIRVLRWIGEEEE